MTYDIATVPKEKEKGKGEEENLGEWLPNPLKAFERKGEKPVPLDIVDWRCAARPKVISLRGPMSISTSGN